MRHLLLPALLIATPALGAEPGARWAEIGEAEVTIDGARRTLVVLDDLEKGRDGIETFGSGAIRYINLTAVAIGEDGEPERPYLQITLRPASAGLPASASFEWYGAESILAANSDTDRKIAVDDVEVGEDGGIRLAFSGVAVPATYTDGALSALDGAADVPVSGVFSAEAPTP